MSNNNDSSLTLRTVTTECTLVSNSDTFACSAIQTNNNNSNNNNDNLKTRTNSLSSLNQTKINFIMIKASNNNNNQDEDEPFDINKSFRNNDEQQKLTVHIKSKVTPISIPLSAAPSATAETSTSTTTINDKPKSKNFATINWFTLFMCLVVMLTNALTVGYRNSVITTIEKCYEFSSIISGVLSGALEVGSLIATLLVSYFCAKSHIPKCIAISSLVCSLGSLVHALPHFLAGDSYTTNNKVMNKTVSDIMCKSTAGGLSFPAGNNNEFGEQWRSSPHEALRANPFGIDPDCLIKPNHYGHFLTLILANVLIGTSSAPLYTLGTAYIDNHVSQENSSVYLAFIYSMLAFGPLIGYLAGAGLLQLYVDVFTIKHEDLKIDPSDSNWVGAWYVGFIIFGVLIFFTAFPFFYFPNTIKKEYEEVPTSEEATAPAMAVIEELKVSSDQEMSSTFGDLKVLPKAIKNLLLNRVFMIVTFAYCFEITIISGFMTFLPKYIEHQFSTSNSLANIFTGGVAIPGAVLGIVGGGFLVKKFRVDPKSASLMAISSNVICLVGILTLLFIGCPNVQMAGTTISYKYNLNNFKLNELKELLHKVQIEQINLKSECNSHCQCSLNSIEPICGRNGISYFSPCYAGCMEYQSGPGSLDGKSKQSYLSCKCIRDDLALSNSTAIDRGGGGDENLHDAHAGLCSFSCQKLQPFLVILFFITFLTTLNQMPMLMVTLRSVSDIERAFALGIQLIIMRLLAYIPSPLIFGQAIDWTCLVWRKNECEQVGSCLLYDREKFRYIYGSIAAIYKCVSLILFAILFMSVRKYNYKHPKQPLDLTAVAVRTSMVSLSSVHKHNQHNRSGNGY